jgi:hypothetical protein
MAPLDDPSDTHGRLIAASKVNGTNVYNRVGEKLGSWRRTRVRPITPS